MDRSDKLINNREARTTLLFFAVLLILSAAAAWIISGLCADRIVTAQIRSMLSAVGGGKFNTDPDPQAVAEGESLLGVYGVSSGLAPRMMSSWVSVRMTLFKAIFCTCAAVCVIWLIISLRALNRVYDGVEEIRCECLKIAENCDYIPMYSGDDLSSVRRTSEGVVLVAQRLRHLSSALEGDKKMLTEFLSDLSHQLKTSLAVIRLNTDILAETDSIPPERVHQLIGEAGSALDGMEELVLAALKLARLNAGAVEYKMEMRPLADTCAEALSRLAPLLREGGITAKSEISQDIVIPHDRMWLCEAVTNIVKNSIDHAKCTEISLSAERSAGLVTLSITDNGEGMPQEQIPRLFERFSHKSGGTGMTSVGLGLNISRKIAIAHGGDILVYSSPGKGTRFDMAFLIQ